MNEFTRKMKSSLSADKPQRTKKKSRVGQAILYIFPAIVVAFILICLRIQFTTQIDRMNQEAAQIDTEIEQLTYTIQNLQNRKAELCTQGYIRSQIARHNLPLVPRQPHQLTYINGSRTYQQAAVSGEEKLQYASVR